MINTIFRSSRCFFAHSVAGANVSEWQPLAEHLRNVGELARDFAATFNGGAVAQTSGLLHDLGKYTNEFQEKLHGNLQRVDHSTWGAIIAAQRFGALGQLLAYGIAGHHAGLANGMGDGERTVLADRLQLVLPMLNDTWQHEIQLPEKLELPVGFKTYGNSREQAKERKGFQLAFLTRMLFSCLVDADFLDTERFYNRAEGRPDTRHADTFYPTLDELRAQLDRYLEGFKPDRDVNRLRADVLNHVRQEADHAPGLFSLTVPTGGGKTITSLAFALDHAIRHRLQRVIFVIPFTSIVEQNAAVFRKALGALGERAVLEHHSAFVERKPPQDDPERYQAQEKLKLAAENWDAPVVVTTAVQFFESLFAAKPSQCRKLHNMASSVVILDEAQTMPLKLLRPCVAVIDELARNYCTSIVLCTATQPALEAPKFEGGLTGVHELAPDPAQLFKRLQRVRVRHVGILSDEALADHMRVREQVLCIVNNRRHARSVYQTMADLPSARHLTTYMCAKHRSAVLADVRRMLRSHEPCRLVATSLIEAGVDVDFPTVLRAEAGLDSIAQAAGRCNREGLHAPSDSEVLVFASENQDWAPPAELRQYAQAGREVLRNLNGGDPLAPEAMFRYFSLLYWQKGSRQLDKPNLMGLLQESRIESLPLETLAAEFRMIDNVQVPVIIPYDDEAKELLKRLEFADHCGGIARKLQPYLVQVPQRDFTALYNAGAVAAVKPEKWEDQFMQLVNLDLYDANVGLCCDDPTFLRSEHLNW